MHAIPDALQRRGEFAHGHLAQDLRPARPDQVLKEGFVDRPLLGGALRPRASLLGLLPRRESRWLLLAGLELLRPSLRQLLRMPLEHLGGSPLDVHLADLVLCLLSRDPAPEALVNLLLGDLLHLLAVSR